MVLSSNGGYFQAIYILDLVGGWVVYGYIVTHNSYYSDAASK